MEAATSPSPDRLLDIAQAFWRSKALLSAVELDLFSVLAAEGPLELEPLAARVGLHHRGARDFLDALVALDVLERSGDGRYANTREADLFLDRRKPTYSGGFIELCNARLYPAWARLTQALQTGQAVTDAGARGSEGQFERLYADASSREVFLKGMTGGVRPVAQAIAQRFPWRRYRTVVDVGCAEGCLLVEVARAHPHLVGCGFDLPAVAPSFAAFVDSHRLADRLTFQPGDFRRDAFPRADVVVMGRVLHNWDLETKRRLLQSAAAALAPGGALLVYERMIDDGRRTNLMALLASLNMLVVTPGGFDFTGAECTAWMREAGFVDTRIEPLVVAHTMVVATK